MPPIPTPPTNSPVTGGSWASGPGNTQTSGEPADFAEYTQWMTIDYTRNPYFTTEQPLNYYRSLVELSAVDVHNVMGTYLHFNITVHTSCKIIKSSYTLSASLQMQKFAVNSSKYDKVGYTYGEVSGASSLYVFGPVGSIVTTQPYIRRDVKTAADKAYYLTQVGVSHSLMTSSCKGPSWNKCDNISQDYKYYIPRWNDINQGYDDFGSKSNYARWETGWPFLMQGGGYNTSAEPGFEDNAAGIQHLQTFIETNCGYLGDANYKMRFLLPIPTVSDGYSWIQSGDKLAVNPYYNTAFHDYN